MDHNARESGHLMLITPERVFYAGLLGRPRQRCSGAFHVYVAIKGGSRLAVEGAVESYGELAVVPPDVRHTIASDYRSVICVLIEPETVRAGAFDVLAQRLSGPERAFFARPHPRRLRGAAAPAMRGDISSAEFDRMCFGEALPRRRLDPRGSRARSRRSNDSAASRQPRQAARRKRDCRPRASCICSSRRPASPSARSGPGSGRGIFCTSPIRTSILRIWRRISAIPIPPISAIRSAGTMA